MKLYSYYQKLNFKNKLILVFSLIITASVLFIGLFSYYETSAIIQKDVEKFSSKNLREVNLNLERYFSQYEQIFFSIASSPEYRNWLNAKKGDQLNIGLNYSYIEDHFTIPATLLNPEVITISLLNDNGNANTFYLNSDVNIVYDYSVKDDGWIKSTVLNKTNILTCKNYIYTSNNKIMQDLYLIRLTRKYHYNANASGYIEIDVGMEPIQKILNEMKYADSGEGMLINETGTVMTDTDSGRITRKLEQDLYNGIKDKDSGYIFDKRKNRVIVFSTLKSLGWKSIAIIPYDAVAEGVGRIWSITLAAILCSIALSVLLVIIISSSLTKRIKILRKSMKQMKSEGFGKKVNISGNDEIRELADTYNIMLDNLDRHIHELTESKLLQQQAVLSALQAQINSHFLYNTLEFINSMAYISGQKEIRKAVISLAKMLRYTSSYKETTVTIKDEIDHLEDYLTIMKMQMGDRLHYKIDMEDGIEDVLCLKAIIQPIVENSIKHGLELKDTEGHIEVKVGYSGEYAYVSVNDDGKGFPDDKLEEVRKQLETEEDKDNIKDIAKVGLVNVNYRLKVFYNYEKGTGISVANVWKRNGAQVRLTFPLRTKGES